MRKRKDYVALLTKPYVDLSFGCLFIYLSEVTDVVVDNLLSHTSAVGLDVLLKQHLRQHS